MVFDRGWPSENVEFIREFVTKKHVVSVVHKAAAVLKNEPEAHVASKLVAELDDRLELIESRVSELPELLGARQSDRWTV
jgi:hypothetical protein